MASSRYGMLTSFDPRSKSKQRLVVPEEKSQTETESDEEDPSVLQRSGSKEQRQRPVCADGAGPYLSTSLSELFLGSKLNMLFFVTPFAFVSKYAGWGDATTFTLALVSLIPFAERVSFVTEDVAKYTNETLGGLLNATFGNITELIVSIFALRSGLIRVVQVSMLGSVLSNLLLVLGSAFFIGGMRHKEQKFNKTAVVTNSGLLIVAMLALSLPSILDTTHTGTGAQGRHANTTFLVPGQSWLSGRGSLEEEIEGGDAPLWLSRVIAGVMLTLYCLLLVFQLKTHTYLFEGEEDSQEASEPGILGLWGGIFWLGVITAFISLLSDFIVDAIEGAAKSLHVPILFISGILVPIVGNAAEHAAAVVFAYRNKMEISLGSAVGSAVQIAVFVLPLCVMIGWAFGTPMTLNCHIFETAVVLLTCISVTIILMDGKSNWLKGAMLVFAYIIISASLWAHADPLSMN